jgi:arsenite transporter
VAGVASGQRFPDVFRSFGTLELAHVSLPVGMLIWIMIVPMLVQVDFLRRGEVRRPLRGIGVTLFVNSQVKLFAMAFLGGLFIRAVFSSLLPTTQIDSYIAGLILLASVPCTATGSVCRKPTNGHPLFTLSQVEGNDTIMVIALAPVVALLLGFLRSVVPWATLLTSVVPLNSDSGPNCSSDSPIAIAAKFASV